VQNMNVHDVGAGAYPGAAQVPTSGTGQCKSGSPGVPCDDWGYHAPVDFLDFSYRSSGVTFRNNTISHCGGHNQIQVDGDRGSALVVGNHVTGWVHNAIDVKRTVGCKIVGNVTTGPAYANVGACLYLENSNGAIPLADVTFSKNVCYGNVPNGIECEAGPSKCMAYNNTVSLGGASAIVTGGSSGITWDIKNNIFDTRSMVYMPNASKLSVSWDYNDRGGTQTPQNNLFIGPHDLVAVNPQYRGGGNYEPTNAAVINTGMNGVTDCKNYGICTMP